MESIKWNGLDKDVEDVLHKRTQIIVKKYLHFKKLKSYIKEVNTILLSNQ